MLNQVTSLTLARKCLSLAIHRSLTEKVGCPSMICNGRAKAIDAGDLFSFVASHEEKPLSLCPGKRFEPAKEILYQSWQLQKLSFMDP
jgi:hypothetical protein